VLFVGKKQSYYVPRGWLVIFRQRLEDDYPFSWRLVNCLGYVYDFRELSEAWDFSVGHFHYLRSFIHTGLDEDLLNSEGSFLKIESDTEDDL
jgi:hypothetical protein